MRSIVYHQFRRNCISSKRSFVYHQADRNTHLRCDGIQHGVAVLMIYTLTRDDIPSPSAWIKNSRSEEREFFVFSSIKHEHYFFKFKSLVRVWVIIIFSNSNNQVTFRFIRNSIFLTFDKFAIKYYIPRYCI